MFNASTGSEDVEFKGFRFKCQPIKVVSVVFCDGESSRGYVYNSGPVSGISLRDFEHLGINLRLRFR